MEPDRGEATGSQPESENLDASANRQRLIEIRCGFAQLSRREADAAYARVAEARDAYYRQLALVTRVSAEVNPEVMRTAKEAAHREFRARVEAAQIRSHVELAATVWLDEINRLNRGTREDQVQIKREREEAARMDAELDRLTATAETSRTMAEDAEAACRAAQQGLGELDEAQGDRAVASSDEPATSVAADESVALDQPVAPPVEPLPVGQAAGANEVAQAHPLSEGPPPAESPPPAAPKVDFGGPRPPTIVRLLRRDRTAMNRLVGALAGDDVDQRRRWQLLLSNFVDAVVAAAIDTGCLEFPSENRFWNQFDREQSREVARGLAALGF